MHSGCKAVHRLVCVWWCPFSTTADIFLSTLWHKDVLCQQPRHTSSVFMYYCTFSQPSMWSLTYWSVWHKDGKGIICVSYGGPAVLFRWNSVFIWSAIIMKIYFVYREMFSFNRFTNVPKFQIFRLVRVSTLINSVPWKSLVSMPTNPTIRWSHLFQRKIHNLL